MKEIEELEFRMRGVDNLSRPLKSAEGKMRDLGRTVDRTNKKMSMFGSNLTGMGKGTRAFAMGSLQQAGYQIGDFAVQVANGTSRMQAFGQQAPQFLQIFGPIGSAVGAAVAVFAAFATVQQKTAGTSKTLSEKVEGLKTSIDALDGIDEMLRESLEAPILAANTALTAYLAQLREAQLAEVIGNVRGVGNDMIAPLIEKMTRLNTFAERTRKNVISMMEAGDDPAAIQRLINRITKQEKIADTLNEMATTIAMGTVAKDTEELAQNLLDARQSLQEQGLLTEELSAGFDEMLEKGGLLTIVYQKQKALGIEITDGIKQINKEGEYHDRIIRAQNINQSNLVAQYDQMLEAHKERKKFLDDELLVMSQQVKLNSFIYPKSDVQGGRGGRGGPTFEELLKNDPRVQLSHAIMQQRELENKQSTKAAEKQAKVIKEKLSPEMLRMIKLSDAIGQSMEDAMMSAVDGTTKAKDAFRLMARDIINELYRVFIVKKITGFISSFITDPSMFGGAGQATNVRGSSPRPVLRAEGGAYTGNGARAGGMDGKGGFMAMLHPRETVVDHTKGQGGGVTVVQNINVSTGVQQTVRTEIKSLMPQIANSAKAAVLDAKRRGGSYGRAFS